TTTHAPKLYGKLNWNINDSNTLTVTGLRNAYKTWTNSYDFDYGTSQRGTVPAQEPTYKNVFDMWTVNYSSYLTDALTLNAMFGKMHGEYGQQQPSDGFRSLLAAYRERFAAGSGVCAA